MNTRPDIYQAVTDRIIAALEAGTPPWVCPWVRSPEQAYPANLGTGRHYRGINVLLLNMQQMANGYPLNRWLTYQQANAIGGQVRKGEAGTQIIFYKMLDIEGRQEAAANDAGNRKVVPLLRSFTVFNAAQVDGLERLIVPAALPEGWTPVAAAEELLSRSGAVIRHGGDRAFYRPADDSIQLPPPAMFPEATAYYGVALHELTHWTSHESRCNRVLTGRQHIDSYAFEELIAEMGAAFLCGHCGIKAELQHASYISTWLSALKNDKRLIFTAASAAQRAADFLIPEPSVEAQPAYAGLAF